MNELIRSLVEAYGPSGYEDAVRDLIRPLVEPHADEISVDAMGNLIVRKRAAAENPLKVMIAAHMDEIGVMATHITADGFLRFTNIGGVGPHTLLGGRVRFADGTLGVIGADRNDDRSSIHPLSKHFIDVGATSRDDCPVRVGDAAHFERPFVVQGADWEVRALGTVFCVRLRGTEVDVPVSQGALELGRSRDRGA